MKTASLRSLAASWKPVAGTVLIGALGAVALQGEVISAGGIRQSVVALFGHRGLLTTQDSVVLLDKPSALRPCRIATRAWHPGEPADIYLIRATVTSSGSILEPISTYNLTQTPADEGSPKRAGSKLLFTVNGPSGTVGVRALDLDVSGQPEKTWTRMQRLQQGLTDLQQTGQWSGVSSRFWSLAPPGKVEVRWMPDGWIAVSRGNKRAWLPSEGGPPSGDDLGLTYHPTALAHPGNLVTWAVDRVRGFSWFGDERMQTLKAVSFGVLDWVRRKQTAVLGDDTAKEIEEDFGDIASRNPPTNYTDPETGWPPAPIKPFLRKPMKGEGKWIPLKNDPFIKQNPGAPPAFVTSFVRTDRKRAYTRIYVTLWDPRQVQLHMMAGSVEPKGATGEAGPGLIPRTPKTMTHLVAAMNGGFQAMHGEWGMMADGSIYLPPKPYAATIADMRDGWTGFGTWPRDPVVPPTILSYRQNLTPLVMDGKINPYRRTWWGGTPPEWEDRVHTTRTGICLTKENFVGYFYGNEIDMMPLAQAMVQTRCQYGIHLDMNPGHTGLEFYRVAPKGKLAPLGRPLDKKWEARGPVPRMPGWEFQARRMVRFMGLMNFPRYIQREGRDFFYLTLRSILPGPNLSPIINPAIAHEGIWRTKGLPQHGFPYAVATTTLRPQKDRPNTHVLLLKIDPRTLRVASTKSPAKLVVSFAHTSVAPNQPSLWLHNQTASISSTPVPGAYKIVSSVPSSTPNQPNSGAVAAVGIQPDGMIVYAEVQQGRDPAADPPMLSQLLGRLGCSDRKLLLSAPLLPTFGQDALPAASARVVRLTRVDAPGARRIFRSTPVVSTTEWMPLQAKRIRYFKKKKKPAEQ